MVASDLLEELKERLTAACGGRLRGVVLFGSEARGEARPDSDIDVLAVLETLTTDYGDELERCLAAVYPVAMRLGRRVSVKPLTREEFEQGDSPLLREVRRSGVAACRIAGRQNEKITILGEGDPPEFEGSLQEPIVAPVGLPVLCDCQHIDLELPQAVGYRRGTMTIQREREVHVDTPTVRSFARAGDGSCRYAIQSTPRNCSRISFERTLAARRTCGCTSTG